jgi:hypothetical protein
MKINKDSKTVFFLSPANLSGRRAQILLNPKAEFDLAIRLRTAGAPIGEVFSFISGLYFRGKLAYASAFCEIDSTADASLIFIITATRGLLRPSTVIRLEELGEMATVPISNSDLRYRLPLERDATDLVARITDCHRIVLLGSVATQKYLEPLFPIFGSRLMIPTAFIGLGDMSRGSLLLRAVRNRDPLSYIGVEEVNVMPKNKTAICKARISLKTRFVDAKRASNNSH